MTAPIVLEALRGHTPGPWFIPTAMGSSGGVAHADGYVCFTAIPREVDETRQPDESWLDMRNRTDPAREAIKAEEYANRRLLAAAPALLAELTTRRARDAEVEALVTAVLARAALPETVTLDYRRVGTGDGREWWSRRGRELEAQGYSFVHESDDGCEEYVLPGLGDDIRAALAPFTGAKP